MAHLKFIWTKKIINKIVRRREASDGCKKKSIGELNNLFNT